MNKKYSFPELECHNCPDYQRVGNFVYARYCNGFPKKKKPRRFGKSDPKCKAPRWCPKRLSIPICRVYGFADTQGELMDCFERARFDLKERAYLYPTESRYKLRLEFPLNMKAKQFFAAVQSEYLEDVLFDADVQYGEVIEIDDGLQPYYFYYLNLSTVIPVGRFDRSRVQTKEADID